MITDLAADTIARLRRLLNALRNHIVSNEIVAGRASRSFLDQINAALVITTNANPLIEQATSHHTGACCAYHYCRSCGDHVSGYNANESLIKHRPQARGAKWWVACDNADCEHAYGEVLGEQLPKWIEQKIP